MSTSRRVRIARALYGALLRLAPPATRRDYEAEMRVTFNALSERADAADGGPSCDCWAARLWISCGPAGL